MEFKAKDEDTLRRYLLGNVSSGEQGDIELWLMADDDAYDLIVAAEDDLIDDSFGGNLSADELRRFNEHFLAAPERQRKLEFSRGLRTYFKENPVPETAPRPEQRQTAWDAITVLFRYRPYFGYAFSALLVLFGASSVWLTYRVMGLPQRAGPAGAVLTPPAQEPQELRRQLEQSQALSVKSLNALDEMATALTRSAPQLVALAPLIPGQVRTGGDTQKIVITGAMRLIRFSLPPGEDIYESYRVVLVDEAANKELLTREHLSATATSQGKNVVFTAPADLFPDGYYTLTLSGITGSQAEAIGSGFHFIVARQ